jgi:hypothetical protein
MKQSVFSLDLYGVDARRREKSVEIALEVYLEALARDGDSEDEAAANPAHGHCQTTQAFMKLLFVERVSASANAFELLHEFVPIDNRAARSWLERVSGKIGVADGSLGERKKQFPGCPSMSKAAVTVWNLGRAYWRFARRSREYNNLSIDPTAGIGGFTGGGDDGANPGREMLGRSELGLEALRDGGCGEAEHIPIAFVLSDDPGPVQGVKEMVSNLARET